MEFLNGGSDALEPEPNYLATVGSPPEPFGLSFDPQQAGVLNALPAEQFPPQIAQDVEGLLFIGHLTDEFDAYGHKFVIRTLKRGDKLVAAKLVQDYESSIGLADAISAATVAASIMLVDNRPLTLPLAGTETSSPEQAIRKQFEIVCKWYDPVVELIYDKYMSLLIRQSQAFREFSGK